LRSLELADLGLALAQLLLGAAPVHGQFLHAGAELLLQPADPLHEELVEVRADDGQKLHPLEQCGPRILGLVQHPAIEGQPGELAVQVPLGRIEIERMQHRFRALPAVCLWPGPCWFPCVSALRSAGLLRKTQGPCGQLQSTLNKGNVHFTRRRLQSNKQHAVST
jgi:hypothetical protein